MIDGVDGADAISLNISAASLRVKARIDFMQDAMNAVSAASRLKTTPFATFAAELAPPGMTLQSIVEPVVESIALEAPSPPPPSLPPPQPPPSAPTQPVAGLQTVLRHEGILAA